MGSAEPVGATPRRAGATRQAMRELPTPEAVGPLSVRDHRSSLSGRTTRGACPGQALVSHAGDEPLDPLIDRTERVLAHHGPLSLVVELEMHPVDGEVTPPFLGPADELPAQLRPGSLRRNRLRLEDVQVTGPPLHGAAALQQVVQAPAAAHVVVG